MRFKELKEYFCGARTVSPMSDSSVFEIMCRKIKNGTDRPYFNYPEIILILARYQLMPVKEDKGLT